MTQQNVPSLPLSGWVLSWVVERFRPYRALNFRVVLPEALPRADGLCPGGAWGLGAGDGCGGRWGKAECLPD